MKSSATLLCLLLTVVSATAQIASPPPSRAQSAGVAAAANELSPVLGQLQQTAQAITLDVARLRIEKWKADAPVKKQAQQNAESITRNVTAAMPGMIDQVRANPQSMGAAFKLYRNVNALYDVFTGLAESAGAFGQKSEYQALANDVGNLDNVRRVLGDRLQAMASGTDSEVTRLRTQVQQAAAGPPPPPKKIVVDDDEKPKKSAKPVKKKKPAAATASKPADQTPPKAQ